MACRQRIPSISGSRELDFPPTIVPCADHRLSSLLAAGIKGPIRSDASASAPALLRKNIDRKEARVQNDQSGSKSAKTKS